MNWTKEEILEYNKRCAAICGLTNLNDDSFPEYIDKFGNFYSMKNLLFHEDWNWIIKVIEEIEKLRYLVTIQSNFCQIQEIGTKENNYQPYIFASEYGESKQEAVVEAINQFLIWYKKSEISYPFKELFPILSDYEVSDWFNVIVYSDKAPSEGDKVLIENKVYNAQTIEDITTDEEYKAGLSYSKVWFCLVEEN